MENEKGFYSKDIIKTSKKDDWETPKDLFKNLDSLFNFTLDPCASKENALCNKFYTKEDDGLTKDWSNEVVFMNPPYNHMVKKWIEKAYRESLKGAVIVCLIPSRTETKYWHKYIFPFAETIKFIEGRLRFSNSNKDAPFPSAIIVFGSKDWPKVLESSF